MHKRDTSWQQIHSWYDQYHQDSGGYYHREVILPKLMPMLNLSEKSHLIDLGCGEGILGRKINSEISYEGFDLSPSLIKVAKQKDLSNQHSYQVADVTKGIKPKTQASDITFILSLQNVSAPNKALVHASKHLKKKGHLWIVMNHPCFRIPKHSNWQTDRTKKTQMRTIDRYLSPFKTLIMANPSKGEKSKATPSFHWPLSDYMKFLKEAGLAIVDMMELCSNKKSYGKMARAENFARKEFPLFMLLKCQKL